MSAVEKATNKRIEESESDNPFHHLNIISSMYYEKKEPHGYLYVAPQGHRAIRRIVEFTSPPRLDAHRSIRKLLELTTDELSLLADPSRVYGAGRPARPTPSKAPDLFKITFEGHYRWFLPHAGNELMVVEHGRPRLPRPRYEQQLFREKAKEAIPSVSEEELKSMWVVVKNAIDQKHGTTIVFRKDAANESIRLRNQATPVSPVPLTPPLVQALSAIDGAILAEPSGICHAIGVILDGIASDRGDAARGSRYNSSLRYVDLCRRQEQECLVVVVSEDGSVDPVF